jgi:hypothetical protein
MIEFESFQICLNSGSRGLLCRYTRTLRCFWQRNSRQNYEFASIWKMAKLGITIAGKPTTSPTVHLLSPEQLQTSLASDITRTRKSQPIALQIASMIHSRTCTALSIYHVRSYIIMWKWTHPYDTQLPAPCLKTILSFSPAVHPLVENSPKHGCTAAGFCFMAQDKRKVPLVLKARSLKRTRGMEVT